MCMIYSLSNWIAVRSFRWKWNFTLFTATLLPLFITLVLVLDIANAYFEAQRKDALLNEAMRIQTRLEERLESIHRVNDNLSRHITSRLSRGKLYDTQNYTDLLNYESMRDNINAMEQIFRIDRIRVFSDRLPFVKRGNQITLFPMRDLEELSAQYPQLMQPAYIDALNYLVLEKQILPSKNIWNSGAVRTISFFSNVYNTDRELVAVFMSEFLAKDFLLDAQNEAKSTCIRLTSAGGDVITEIGVDSSTCNLLELTPAEGYVLQDDHLIYVRTLENVDFCLKIALPFGNIDIQNSLVLMYMGVVILSFALSLVASLAIGNQQTRRLHRHMKIVKSMEYTSGTDAEQLSDQLDQLIISSQSRDEFDQLLALLSTQIRDNLKLLSHTKQHDLDIEKYKFQVLQEQINPHFLYNTLETIQLCMNMSRHEDAIRTLTALSKFYRIALSKGRDTIDIFEELNMIRCYLEIENTGYEGRIHWDIQVDELCLALPVPKFLLQPLIENSIVHGRSSLDKRTLNILVDIHIEGDIIVMRVVDDGIGIDPDTLLRLRDHLSSHEVPRGMPGYGLRNVSHRLKLFFGDSYDLVIESGTHGTVSTIRLPISVL